MTAINAILPYYGSKRSLAPLIVKELGDHASYWEPFCGSLSVLLAKDQSTMETVCDASGDLVNLARVIRCPRQSAKLYGQLARTLAHEELYHEALETISSVNFVPPEADRQTGDVQRAYAYFVASWLGRNGLAGTTKSAGKGYAVRWGTKGGNQATRFRSAVGSMPDWVERIQGVAILRRDAFRVLAKIKDEAGTAIYCDPPYVTKKAAYLHDFKPGDHGRLAELLHRFRRARVVLSYYDHPTVRALYGGWTVLRADQVQQMACSFGTYDHDAVPTAAPELLLINGPSYSEQEEWPLFEQHEGGGR